jgi:pyruvate dehydrogenase E1 component alpha subunit
MLTRQDLIDFEKKLAKQYDEGEYPYLVHLSGGNEDQLIDVFYGIERGDWVFSTHRSHYHYLLAGGRPEHLENLVAQGKSMFVFDKGLNFYSSSILAGTAAIAAGVAWALKRKGSDKKVWCFIGDGAADEGHFYEAARYVDGWDLPCTFVIEDNDRSVNSGKTERWGEYIEPCQFRCVKRYKYEPTYPHGGSGTPGWLKFKREAQVQVPYGKRHLSCVIPAIQPMKYKQAVVESMNMMAKRGVIFVGYNVTHGAAYGTLIGVPEDQLLETPVAENLMAGLAMGMSLEGFRPVLFFERHDFVLNAVDALVNQMDKIEQISDGQFNFPVIIRAVSGSVKPFYAGLTHTSNLTSLFDNMFSFPVFEPKTSAEVVGVYRTVLEYAGPVLISEPKELHEEVV